MLDDQVRGVLAALEEDDARERAAGVPAARRSLPCGPEAGRLLFALAASSVGCRVLEIGGSRGYSTIWLAAGARLARGSVVSLELDAVKIAAWRANLANAGLDGVAELCEGDAFASLEQLEPGFQLVFLDAWKDDYERYFATARPLLRPGSVVVADNVDTNPIVAAYAAARQADPALVSVTVPIGNGLEVTTLTTL